ncbi:MAG: acetate--CoA ligase family protein, partial [Xanthobacteraceae bacterium]
MPAHSAVERSIRAVRKTLTEPISKKLLREAGIAIPRGVVIEGPLEVAEALRHLAFPVVAKIVSADVMHKSDVGGVRLNLTTARGVEEAVAALEDAATRSMARLDGYLIEEMAPPGVEMVIGGIHDPCFGPMVMVGMGGIHVEVFEDVCYRLCPITPEEAAGMLHELRCARLLDGIRGTAPCSREALIDILLKLGGEGGFLMRNPSIVEVDLNPVIVSAKSAVVADAAIVQCNPTNAKPGQGAALAISVLEQFRPLFEPSTVAVIGASAGSSNAANTFIRRLRAFGFSGAIYP